jgi:glutathione S-transferase
LALRTERARNAPDQLTRLNERIRDNLATTLNAEVIGKVEYSEGDGAELEVRRGLVEIEISRLDTVFSWQDENYRAQAAIPFQKFWLYVCCGAFRLVL